MKLPNKSSFSQVCWLTIIGEMEPIRSVLKEELSNSLLLKRKYEGYLKKLPKGVLVCKVIKGHKYYYLARREGKKVRYLYKGKLSRKEVKEFEEVKRMRKNIKDSFQRLINK